jgi:hypothetical protein
MWNANCREVGRGVWIGLVQGPMGGCCEHGTETSVFLKC